MKIVFYSDVHFSTYSSILRKRGSHYSVRLESCINSVGWAEDYAEQIGADLIVIGGDFFDRSDLNAEELTALKEIYFSQKLPHIALIGNHEMKTRDRTLTSAHLFQTLQGSFDVVDMPYSFEDKKSSSPVNLVFLPYIEPSEIKPFSEYLPKNSLPTVVFSHNDIAGIQMGSYVSKEGFQIKEIEDNCNLFINGHLHNGAYLNHKKTLLNVGNLTGKDFGEDGFLHKHQLAVIDTDTLTVELVDNPYAIYFYKIQLEEKFSPENLLKKLSTCTEKCCLTIKVNSDDVQSVRQLVDTLPKVIDYRLIATNAHGETPIATDVAPTFASIDHIQTFKAYVLTQLGDAEILQKELQELV